MGTNLYKMLAAFLLILITTVSGELKIVNFKVPSTIEFGYSDDLILDCDYYVKGKESGLEVKWFFTNGEVSNEQIYQWIPEKSKPAAMGFLRTHLDLGYTASTDPKTMYRALKIRNITKDLTGNYTCKVTSFFSEDTSTKPMTIYEPAKDFELINLEESNTVLCSAYGVYPKPVMNLYILNSTDSSENQDNSNETQSSQMLDLNADYDGDEEDASFEKDENDVYNVTFSKTYDAESMNDLTTFVCDLSIPGTTYKKTRKYLYLPENSSTSVASCSLLVSTMGFIAHYYKNYLQS
ncbi:PREDICTED: uncharacterized protein LOC108557984 isoform X2 [Nicrophorus vespilloides]|uniref:Uncharacterized protein LOC108557984 isoform X2 n=1 Tax=Nicrophorus vespilloides TaxID=110193 RepID=A0ABM1M6N3_NICVS|nr:PREDICTED: uncharacterized protein LOC108557984 isoform X2 [Nicrophorus vespilloides]